jgi:hypothetical protein
MLYICIRKLNNQTNKTMKNIQLSQETTKSLNEAMSYGGVKKISHSIYFFILAESDNSMFYCTEILGGKVFESKNLNALKEFVIQKTNEIRKESLYSMPNINANKLSGKYQLS